MPRWFLAERSCFSANSKGEDNKILMKDPSSTIKTPGYSGGYPGDLIVDYHWKIIVPKGHVVRIEFSSFWLYERVRIFDLDDEDDSAVIEDSINGLNPDMWCILKGNHRCFFSTGNELGIKVNGRAGNSGPGFIADVKFCQFTNQVIDQLTDRRFTPFIGKGNILRRRRRFRMSCNQR